MQPDLAVYDLGSAITTGDIAALSRAITLAESTRATDQEKSVQLIDYLLPQTGRSIRIGITGVPGVGKSTFIESFGMYLAELGRKVAVLAVDPSSSKTRGSILGDKTRMERLSVHPNAFIRPTASSGSLGGVAYKTREATLLCEAAGFDIIIIETVGVGQSETEVSGITDFFLLLMLAGAGDELQGIKRGIMEMADGVAITKADGTNVPKAKAARNEFARAMHFLPPTASGWIPQAKICSAVNNEGIEEIWKMIVSYHDQTVANHYFKEKRKQQQIIAFERLLNEQLFHHFLSQHNIKSQLQELKQLVESGSISPYSAVVQIRQIWKD